MASSSRGKQQEPVCSKCGTHVSQTPAGKARKAAMEAQQAQMEAKQQQAVEQAQAKQAAVKQAMTRMQQGQTGGMRRGVPPQMGARAGMGAPAQGRPQLSLQELQALAQRFQGGR